MKQKTDVASKPYNRCLQCQHRKVRCDGPRTSAMTLARWCEFMRDMKEVNGLTNAYIEEKSGVSLKTIERIMAMNCEQDIMRETARRIEDAIIGSSNQNPCYLAFEENVPEDAPKLKAVLHEMEHVLSDNRQYKTILENIHSSYKAEMQFIRDEAKGREETLLTQIERLRQEIDYLRLENDRKARVIDKFLEK